jgi:tetratricopeptide (TPR) repeat protein
MIALLVVLVAAFIMMQMMGGAPILRVDPGRRTNAQAKITELSQYAERLRHSNKFLTAEKAYLQILKMDPKHAATYSRLGTLYIALKDYDDAIECLQIASQLAPAGLTFYNLGLGYFENQKYDKSVSAFEKAIMFEPSGRRYIGLAKAHLKIGDDEQVVKDLEHAVKFDNSPKVLWMLHDAYIKTKKTSEAEAVKEQIKAAHPKDPRLKTPLRSPLETAA